MITDGPIRQHSPAPAARTAAPGASPSRTVPALAFGSGLTALGVLRSLQSSGIPVFSACPEGDLATKSRWYRAAPRWEGRVPEPEQLRQYLEQLPMERAVLFPCSDDWTRAISEMPEHLRERFPASISDAKVIGTMTDKWRFSTFVECLDIPRPKTVRVDSMAALEALDQRCFGDMFLKPIDSQEFSRRNRAKAFYIRGKQHAVDVMRRVVEEGGCGFPILLQEFIPGPPTQAYIVDGFIDRHRQLRTLVARHRLGQYPPMFGNTSRCETVPLDQVRQAIDSLERMWSTVPYRGIFSAEFKLDPRDGQMKIVEVNARPWWFVEFVNTCGVNVCRMSYEDALDLPVTPAGKYALDRRCVHLRYDLASHLEEDRGPMGILRWMRSVSGPFMGPRDVIYRWDDPWPGVHTLLGALRTYRRRRQAS